jgi:hypothetical protein
MYLFLHLAPRSLGRLRPPALSLGGGLHVVRARAARVHAHVGLGECDHAAGVTVCVSELDFMWSTTISPAPLIVSLSQHSTHSWHFIFCIFSHALRKQSPLSPIMPWGPTIDGSSHGLLRRPIVSIRRGAWNKVPLIIGTNNNEGSIFVPLIFLIVPGLHFPLQDADFAPMLMHFFDQVQCRCQITSFYSITNSTCIYRSFSEISSFCSTKNCGLSTTVLILPQCLNASDAHSPPPSPRDACPSLL